jgi:predicted transcriptional regulator
MLKVKECKKYILEKNLDDSKIEEIRNTLSAIVKDIIKKNIESYERTVK